MSTYCSLCSHCHKLNSPFLWSQHFNLIISEVLAGFSSSSAAAYVRVKHLTSILSPAVWLLFWLCHRFDPPATLSDFLHPFSRTSCPAGFPEGQKNAVTTWCCMMHLSVSTVGELTMSSPAFDVCNCLCVRLQYHLVLSNAVWLLFW